MDRGKHGMNTSQTDTVASVELKAKQKVALICTHNGSGSYSSGLRQILGSQYDCVPIESSVSDCGPHTDTLKNCALVLVEASPQEIPQNLMFVTALRAQLPLLPLLFCFDGEIPAEASSLLSFGAVDYLKRSSPPHEILLRVAHLLGDYSCPASTTESLREHVGLSQIIGRSPVLLAEVRKIPLVAHTDISVLISGETGTGKEVFARAIHYLSSRAGKPFVAVNCGALPVELIENELFGHEAGAYTGGTTSKRGVLAEAEYGTIFLDEVDCLTPLAQTKLLRFLQEKEYRPVGSPKSVKADVRVIGATNIDVQQALLEGKLRKDLYYRLNVVPFALPSLRDRSMDIPILAHHFLKKYRAEFNKASMEFAPDAMKALMQYDWPGNIRELENTIERAILVSDSNVIHSRDLMLTVDDVKDHLSFRAKRAKVVAEFEKKYLEQLLAEYGGNITKAASAAKQNRRTFWQLLRKHNLHSASDIKHSPRAVTSFSSSTFSGRD